MSTFQTRVVVGFVVAGLLACGCSRADNAAEADPLFVTVDSSSRSATDVAIATAQARLRVDEHDDDARLGLAVAFLQKVRETADPTLYANAETILDDLGERYPDDPRVLVARGTLALAQHRFTDALELGQQALHEAPGNPNAYGVLVDAYNELGRYDDALETTEEMVNTKPGVPSYSRVSYARELRGDYDGAIDAMNLAVNAAASSGGENLAYVQTLLGQLKLTNGDIAGADRAYAAALVAFPDFAAARAGQARVLVARGQYGAAADLLADVLQVQPQPDYAIAHGDALAAAGRADDAADAYELVDAISSLFAENGVRQNLELALFAADHAPGADAVAQARAALEARPSSLAHDVLAWNLFRAGDLDEAAAESELALALGSRDPQERFHAAMIAEARGDTPAATEHLQVVLATNPRFNAAFVADVERLATELGLALPPAAP